MVERIKLALYMFCDAIKQRQLMGLLRGQVFYRRSVIPAVADLTALDPRQNPLENSNYRLVELMLEDLASARWAFPSPIRRLKAERNLKSGMRGFALVETSTAVGDIWCVAPHNKEFPVRHRDLEMLKITCREGDFYSFDLFIDPAYRGRKLSIRFHRAFELAMKQEGWRRNYLGFWEDDIPAVMIHRALDFEELPKQCVSRFFSLIKSHNHH